MKFLPDMVPTSKFATAPRKRGFTLIELMVATAIMALLVLAVMTITSHVLSSWSSASGRLGANAEARTALQYLGDDLETLVVRPRQQAWLQVSYDNILLGSTGSTKTVQVPNIALITATEHRLRSANDYGNICAVNYQLAFQNPIIPSGGGTPEPLPVAGLYRKVINPETTFNGVLASPATGTGIQSLLALMNAADNSATTTFANFLSSNIADLSIDFYAEDLNAGANDPEVVFVGNIDGNNRKTRVPFVYADKLYGIGDNGNVSTALVTNQSSNYGRLLYADIRMTVLSDEGAKALAVAQYTGQDVNDIIKQYGTVFSRRVPILSRY